MAVEIRQAEPGDTDAVQFCAQAAYQMYVERIGKQPAPMMADFAGQISDGIVWVLTVQNAVAGFVVYYSRGDHIHLENVAVDPEYRGKGLGGRLIKYVEDQALCNGAQAVELYTNAKMTENLKLYPRLGYAEIVRRREDGFDRVYFRKDLRSP